MIPSGGAKVGQSDSVVLPSVDSWELWTPPPPRLGSQKEEARLLRSLLLHTSAASSSLSSDFSA